MNPNMILMITATPNNGSNAGIENNGSNAVIDLGYDLDLNTH